MMPVRGGGARWARLRAPGGVGDASERRGAALTMGMHGAAASSDDTTRLDGPELAERVFTRAGQLFLPRARSQVLPGCSARRTHTGARNVSLGMSRFVLVVEIYGCKARGVLEMGTGLLRMALGARGRMRIEVETRPKQ